MHHLGVVDVEQVLDDELPVAVEIEHDARGQPALLRMQEGKLLIESADILLEWQRLVGQAAKHQQVTNPKNTVFSIKRFMGRRHNEVQHEEKLVPYSVVGGPSELVKVDIRGKQYTPPEVSAMILQELKKVAEDSRVSVRMARRDANEEVKKALKDKTVSEDEAKRTEAEIQKITDDFIKKIDQVADEKEKSILTI